jgi:integrase
MNPPRKRRRNGTARTYRPTYRGGRTTESWAVEFSDARGIIRRLGTGLSDRRCAEDIARTVERLVAAVSSGTGHDPDLALRVKGLRPRTRATLAKWGLLRSSHAALGRSLEDLLKQFERSLEDHVTPKHIAQVSSRAKRLFAAAGAIYWSELSAIAVERALRSLRLGSDPTRPKAPGIGARTSNFHLAAARQFVRWALENGLAEEDPLKSVRRLPVRDADVRHRRRVLDAKEAHKLLVAAAAGPDHGGVSGAERALAWRLMLETGLRVNEVRTLRVRDFDPADMTRATLTVEAENSKNRKSGTLPVLPTLALALGERTRGKMPSARIFDLPPFWRAAKALAQDLLDAGIESVTEEGCVDAHGLRHSYATFLREAPPRIVTALMRHTPIDLAGAIYQHVGPEDLRPYLKHLPDFDAPLEAEAATGTDGVSTAAANDETGVDRLASNLAVTGTPECETVHSDARQKPRRAHRGAPDRTRTCNPRFRRPMLCPVELRVQEERG